MHLSTFYDVIGPSSGPNNVGAKTRAKRRPFFSHSKKAIASAEVKGGDGDGGDGGSGSGHAKHTKRYPAALTTGWKRNGSDMMDIGGEIAAQSWRQASDERRAISTMSTMLPTASDV
jgi:hypothetical protein